MFVLSRPFPGRTIEPRVRNPMHRRYNVFEIYREESRCMWLLGGFRKGIRGTDPPSSSLKSSGSRRCSQ